MISKPHPRKGTETSYGNGRFQLRLLRYFKTTSPQGDGNNEKMRMMLAFMMYFKTTSPQGDGNLSSIFRFSGGGSFQNHIPARGRKPAKAGSNECHSSHISKPHPRKGTETYEGSYITTPYCSFQNHIPARGRKRVVDPDIRAVNVGISKPHPRKGTETNPESPPSELSNYFKTTSPQGDGN